MLKLNLVQFLRLFLPRKVPRVRQKQSAFCFNTCSHFIFSSSAVQEYKTDLTVSLYLILNLQPKTMKFTTALILASMASTASAFSAVAPSSSGASLGNTDPVDKSLRGIDGDDSTFDPTEGDNAALTRNNNDQVWVPQRARPRRNRKNATMRGMVRENIVTPSNFIYPLFIHEEDYNQAIPSMPGCERHSLESMLKEVGEAYNLGVKTFVLFPKVPDELKTNLGQEAYNPEGIVPRALRLIKAAYPDSIVCTDVALDPYSDQGHDGVVENGKILNDVTINQLCKQAVCQAKAGSDVVAPSDMMVCIA